MPRSLTNCCTTKPMRFNAEPTRFTLRSAEPVIKTVLASRLANSVPWSLSACTATWRCASASSTPTYCMKRAKNAASRFGSFARGCHMVVSSRLLLYTSSKPLCVKKISSPPWRLRSMRIKNLSRSLVV